MIFKKGSVIINKKNKIGNVRCLLLSEDFNSGIDPYISYISCFIVTLSKNKRTIRRIKPVLFKDEGVGKVFSSADEVWYLANSKLTKTIFKIVEHGIS